MSLIEQVFAATESGHLHQPFTVADLNDWIVEYKIAKNDGRPYAQSSIDAILSNSNLKNQPTSNRNRKMLKSRINEGGKSEYWF